MNVQLLLLYNYRNTGQRIFRTVYAVLALKGWNYCSVEQGPTAQHIRNIGQFSLYR